MEVSSESRGSTFSSIKSWVGDTYLCRGLKAIVSPILSKVYDAGVVASRVSNSHLGRVIKCALLEVGGTIIATAAVNSISDQLTGDETDPTYTTSQTVLTALSVAGFAYSYFNRHNPDKAKTTLTISSGLALAANPSIIKTAVVAGAEIVGGYIGLKAGGSKIPIWDRKTPQCSYGVRMTRYIAIGHLFDSIIVKPTSLPGTVIHATSRLLTVTTAYQADMAAVMIKKIARAQKRKRQVFTLHLIQMLSDRYLGESSYPLAQRISAGLTDTITPHLTFQMGTVVLPGTESLAAMLQKGTRHFGKVGIRGFVEYHQLLSASKQYQRAHRLFVEGVMDEELFIDVVNSVIPSNTTYKQAFLQKGLEYCLLNGSTIPDTVDSLIEKIQDLELELIGLPLLKQDKIDILRTLMSIHLKNWILFSLQNAEDFSREIGPKEHDTFILTLHDTIGSTYFHSILPAAVAPIANGAIKLTITSFRRLVEGIAKLVRPPEAEVYRIDMTPPNLIDNYVHSSGKLEMPPKPKDTDSAAGVVRFLSESKGDGGNTVHHVNPQPEARASAEVDVRPGLLSRIELIEDYSG